MNFKDVYYKGLTDGVRRFAWWKDGEEWVGSTGTSLKEALAEIEIERQGQRCDTCGCTEARACEGGCSWVFFNRCSSCA